MVYENVFAILIWLIEQFRKVQLDNNVVDISNLEVVNSHKMDHKVYGRGINDVVEDHKCKDRYKNNTNV